MGKLFKYLKQHAMVILAIIVVLFVQAFCDLSLPTYTSDIVNVGIQQGGIDTTVPEQIGKTDLENLLLLVPQEDAGTVQDAYREGTKEDLDTGEEFVVLKDAVRNDEEQMNELFDILGKPMFLAEGLSSDSEELDAMKEQMLSQMPAGSVQGDVSMFDILRVLPQEQRESMVREMEQQVSDMPDTMLEQTATVYIENIYRSLGVDMDAMQTNYILITGAKMLGLAFLGLLASVTVGLLASRTAAAVGRDLRRNVFLCVMPKFRILQKMVDRVNLVTREILTGLSVIRAFHTEKHEEERFDKANTDLTKTNLFVNRAMTLMMPAMMLIMNGISILIMWVGAHGVDNGQMQVGDMMAFIQYTMQIIMAFLMICMISIMLPRAAVAAGRVDEILTSETAIKDKEEPEHIPEAGKGLVEFDHVSFRYPGAGKDVLHDIHFTAKPGETTAIIGSTGSGKSTLVNLIPRFYDVTEGAIRIDGRDIRNVTQHELREKLGYVPQKGMLFSGTIASNIAYSDENMPMERIEEAAEIAQAKDFIEEKPDDYNSPISQGGGNVSGGQKQRLSIARAVAKHPDIFIFDDSFSALDYKTDTVLRQALKEKTKDSTVIIVAQRISTILHAEQIIVLDEGEIAGIGTHEELLKNCEAYYQIASSQLSREELEQAVKGNGKGEGAYE